MLMYPQWPAGPSLSSEGSLSSETSSSFPQKYTCTLKNVQLLGQNRREFLRLACGALGAEALEHLGFIKYLPEALRREEGVSSCLLRAGRASGMGKDPGFPCSLPESCPGS